MGEGVGFVLYHMIANYSELLGRERGLATPAPRPNQTRLAIQTETGQTASPIKNAAVIMAVTPYSTAIASHKFIGASIG
jgi:hypothetical protein